MQNWVGATLVVGAILFLIAAFMPISGQVFRPQVTPEEQIRAVEASRSQWVISSLLFGAGSVVAVAGLFLFARHVSSLIGSMSELLAYAAAAIAGIGATFWVIVVYYRIVDTPEQVFSGGSLDGDWMFPLYTVMTQVALITVGYVLIQAGYPGWLGWGMIGLVSATILGMIIFRDVPPFLHYVWLLVMGVTLLWTSVPAIAPALATLISRQ